MDCHACPQNQGAAAHGAAAGAWGAYIGCPREAGSPSSPLHHKSGFAYTTQFQAGTSGWSPTHGRFPTSSADHQKHTATPIPQVRVGVT